MRLYTRTGDDGSTGLLGGGRLSKGHGRVEAYGDVDELNAALGLAATLVQDELLEGVQRVQHELFTIGGYLAVMPGKQTRHLPPLDAAMTQRLEGEIDAMEAQLPPLEQFILPGGSAAAAQLHVARTVCRRAERAVVRLAEAEPVPPEVVPYLNRLADWLFAAARLVNHQAGLADVPWRHD